MFGHCHRLKKKVKKTGCPQTQTMVSGCQLALYLTGPSSARPAHGLRLLVVPHAAGDDRAAQAHCRSLPSMWVGSCSPRGHFYCLLTYYARRIY